MSSTTDTNPELKINPKFFDTTKKHKQLTRVLLSLSALGLVLFFLVATIAPFRDKLFQYLYPKPSSRAAITVPDTLRSNLWGAQGLVTAILISKDSVYLGGGGMGTFRGFVYVGPNTGEGVPLDKTSGASLPNYAVANRTVRATISDGNGGWYIGGAFTRVGGLDREWVAHIKPDGSVDPNFNANISGTYNPDIASSSASGPNRNYGYINPGPDGDGIRSLALSPDKSTLYMGGGWYLGQTFIIGGQSRNNIAAVEAATGALKTWAPTLNDGIDQWPRAIVVSPDGSTVYVGGLFNASLNNKRFLYAIDAATGNKLSWNPPIYSAGGIYALAISSDGQSLYAGGTICTSFTSPCGGMAKIDVSTGNLSSSWIDPTLLNFLYGEDIYALALSSDNSTLYAGGNYTGIAAIETASGSAKPFRVHVDDINYSNQDTGIVDSLALSPDNATLYAGGRFENAGGATRYNVAAWDTTSSTLLPWNPTASGDMYALAVNATNTAVFAGGIALSIGNGQVVYRNNLAKLKKDGPVDETFIPAVYPGKDLTKFVLSKDQSALYMLANSFRQAGTEGLPNQPYIRGPLAAVEATSGALLPFNPQFTGGGAPYDMAISPDGSILYIGGNFASVSGQLRNGLAAINLSTGNATSFNPNPTIYYPIYHPATSSGTINSIQLSNDGKTLYVNGNFNYLGGVPVPRTSNTLVVVAIDTATGNLIWSSNYGLPVPLGVNKLILSPDNSLLYGAGTESVVSFDTATGNLTNNFNVSLWDPGGCIPGDMAISCDGKTLFLSGQFTTVGGQPRYNIAALDTTSGGVLSWHPDISVGTAVSPLAVDCNPACASSPSDYAVYFGGCFITVDNEPIAHVAADAPMCVAPTPTPTPTPSGVPTDTPTPTPATSTPTPTSPPSGSGGSSASNPTPTPTPFTPVVPLQGPKTGGKGI